MPLRTTLKPNNIAMKQEQIIYFAGGCFWGMQAYFSQVHGVTATTVGYANANRPNPRYEDTDTDYAETIEIRYDSQIAPLSFLLELYFSVIDPTLLNRQGNDIGRQYRTGIYYTNHHDAIIIEKALAELQTKFSKPIVVEHQPLENFYPAEEYHQQYLKKHPGGYCHIGRAAINQAKEARYIDKEALRKQLTPIQYHVTQENGTEPPFQNDYYNKFEAGIYVDIVSGTPLFLSTDKFESGCGWPAFSKPISEDVLKEKLDTTHNMMRTEIRSKTSNSHLGHVFFDGPNELGGLRYCINSAALRFIPLSKMEAEGYSEYIPLVSEENRCLHHFSNAYSS